MGWFLFVLKNNARALSSMDPSSKSSSTFLTVTF